MTLQEIISQKLKRLDSVPAKFLTELQKVEKDFLKAVLASVSKLQVQNGNIALNNKNLAILAEIKNSLKDSFFQKTQYLALASDFIGEFDKQSILTNQYFAKAFEDKTIPAIAEQVLNIKKESTLNLLLGEKLDANFIEPLKSIVETATTSGASYSKTLSSIQDIVTGNSEIDSKISQYAKQVTHDSFAVSDRAYTKIVSDELGAEWFQWAGDVISTSRTICIENHNKYFHKKEIEAMASKDWSGKMDGTNKETIFQTAGGHHCGHSILPVSIFKVPKDVIERNIANGNYSPSEFEVEEIGL